jgi:uncharacterized protein
MSAENVELVRAAYEAWNRGDVDAVLQYLDPDVELRDPPEAPDAQVWHGHEGYRRQLEQFMAAWAEASIEPEEIVDAGDKVLVRVHYRVRGKGQGIEVELRIFHVITLRDGKGVVIQVHGDEARAREAAGLRP